MAALVLIAALFGGGYMVSCVVHPMRHCRACRGRARFYGSWYTGAFRFCHTCGNRGRFPRRGTKMLVGLGLMKNPERAGTLGWRRRNQREGK